MNGINEIHILSEKLVNSDNKQEIVDTEKALKELLEPYKDGSIGIAQINPIAGDIESNAKKIVKFINHAQNIGLDLVVFPELILTGYPIEDTINHYPVIAQDNVKWIKEIAKITRKTTALVGFIEPASDSDSEKEKYYSSVAVLREGNVSEIIRRTGLPKYPEFNDYKYIKASAQTGLKINTINGIKYGISIGDNNSDFEKLSKEKPDIFINISASYAIASKMQSIYNELSSAAKKYSTPTIFVNQVGAIDKVSFEGASIAFDKNGEVFARAQSFKEQFLIINPHKGLGKIYSSLKEYENNSTDNKEFSLNYEPDLERTYKTLIQGIKDYFGKTGFKRAVLGLSGGLDSTVCAVLLADALGKENVFGISMPSKITSDESKNDAQVLAQNLGINFAQAPIKDMYETTNNCLQKLFCEVEKSWDCRYKESFTSDNIQARSRAMFLWGVSNEFGSCLPIATSDKSEAYMGYATINGDMSGGFAPIADITKTKLFALARWMNKNREQKNVIPQSIIDKRPGAELAIDPKTGKTLAAEDALMPYEFMDEVIWRIENKRQNYQDMIYSEFLYEKKYSLSANQKKEWLEKFYRRMATALYKKSILPPYVIVDSPSYQYKQPITSSNINYKGTTQKDIEEKIKAFIK